jgi:hypothetical protein
MVDWLAIFSGSVLAVLLGVGFVLWERYDNERLARQRRRRRGRPRRRPLASDVGRRAA